LVVIFNNINRLLAILTSFDVAP